MVKIKARPMLIGVSGASGSGKTTIAERIIKHSEAIGIKALLLEMDSYYKDQREKSFDERIKTNYDAPDAFEWPLIHEQINGLLSYNSIEKPVYNFASHLRMAERKLIEPADLIIFEGILTLYDTGLNDLMNYRLFVDTELTTCLCRRIMRDVMERGRSIESVVKQWQLTVEPGFKRYTLPTRFYANSQIIWDGSDAKLSQGLKPIYLLIKDYFEK